MEKSSQAKHDGGEGMEQLVCPMARGCVMTTLCQQNISVLTYNSWLSCLAFLRMVVSAGSVQLRGWSFDCFLLSEPNLAWIHWESEQILDNEIVMLS